MTDPQSLASAFGSTRYEALLPKHATPRIVCIDNRPPDDIASWLGSGAAARGSGWIITADNPGAQVHHDNFNAARRWALDALLDRPGIRWLPTRHHAAKDDWPVEQGRLIVGMDAGLAYSLGRRFGQAAIVALAAQQPTRLCWLGA